MAILGQRFAEAGIGSIAALPLLVSDEAVGVFALYAAEGGFFRREEMQLLNELVHDIAFAIDNIDKHERLNYLAYYDVLTGLANQSLFLERVGQFIRNAGAGGKLALFLIDLERFKNINDSMGRVAGDELLSRIAAWLREYTKDASLIAYVGADHFAVVIPAIRQDDEAARQVESVLRALQGKTFTVGGSELRIGAKIGIALFPEDGTDAETLFTNAEAALKMAKRAGDRYLFHTKTMTEAVAAKLSLENRLRKAIENEEFVLYYQPKVSVVGGNVAAAEALIRWNDPDTGLVPPGAFISILEETGMIYEVGRWVLRQAISDSLRWRDEGRPKLRIAVNVSALQLRSSDFVTDLESKIAIDPQAAAGLQLEITESLFVTNVKQTIDMLGKIRSMGVTISMDDFGTGFSSLSQLALLPLDEIKVDQSFVAKMMHGSKELALVSTIISLAHSLKLNVVAEGVETEEQAHLLGLLACDELQGYLHCKPVPAEMFEKMFLLVA